jgi:ribosomal protein S21
MALRQAYTRLISLRSFAPLASTINAVSTAGSTQSVTPLLAPVAAQLLTPQQSRTAITVPVQNNKVPRALRRLTRTIYGDRLLQEWRDRQHFTKPAKRRFEAKKATELRLRKEEFREKLRWAMQRKARCFVHGVSVNSGPASPFMSIVPAGYLLQHLVAHP